MVSSICIDAQFIQKLGIREGQSVVAVHAPKDFLRDFKRSIPPSVKLTIQLASKFKPDVILWWIQQETNFGKLFRQLERVIQPDGAIWVIIPKKNAAKKKGFMIDWNEMLRAALKTTLVDNKTLSFSDEEYGTRFVIRKEKRIMLR